MDRRDTSDRLSEYATLYEKAAGQVRKPSPSSSSRNPSDYRSSNYRSPPRSQDGRDSGSSTDSFTRRTSLSTDYHPPHTRPPVPIAAPRVPSSPPRQFVGTPPRQMPGTPPRPNPSTPPRQVADSSQRGSRGLLDTDPGARRRSIVGPASTTSSPAHSRSRSRSPHGLGGIISSAIGLSSSRPPPLPLLESTRSDSPPTYSQDEHHQPAAKRDLLATPSNVPTSPDADDASATLMFTDDVDGDIMPGHWQESQRRRRPSNASLGSGDNGAVGGSRERRPSNASDRSLDYTGLSAAYIARAAESRHSVLNSIPETEAAGTWAQQDGSLFDDLDDLPEVNLASVEEVFNAINTLDRTYLIDTLCRTPPDEVARLAMTYRTIHNESPARAIKSRLGGLGSSLLQVLEGCAMGLLEYHIKLLRDSLRASDTDGLTEILAGATLDDLRALKSAYQQVTGVALEVDIHRNSRGLIVSLFDAILNVDRRSAGRRFDPVLDAQDLYEAGEARIGKDQVPFFRILTERSDDHLRQVFDVYERMYGKTIDKVIESEFMINPHTCRALLVLVRSAINRVEEVADMIQTSLGSAIVPVNTTRLTRLVVRYRTPDDRQRVKSAYRRLYGRTLASRIRERTYGDYRLALLACLDEPLEGI
ncbi:Annexin [Gonapodya prolifera JEL478]|uniref:Annexin n=1 Tax=Gonapodya prolifera (strain JEL478) TaxID=1344416 RepID=A0A139AFC7_GONPJ|nr:Annexin [Gonapodya prolifera JEL478]|eukprot:KXS15125.1 Annexin [Gonapodya prolifera JEL478]